MTAELVRALAALAAFAGLGCNDPAPRETALGSVAPAPGDAGSLTLRLLDVTDSEVGGLAVLVSDSSAGEVKHALIDGGERGGTALRALQRFGVASLALVVLTHAHADHFGGLATVLDALPVGAFAYNGDPRALRSYTRLLSAVEREGVRPIVVSGAPRTVAMVTGGDTLVVTLLPPPPAGAVTSGDRMNNRSVGVHLRYGRFTALVPGDAEHGQEAWWARRFGPLVDVDVLVASHHGARDANSTARRRDWYTSVTPRALLVSANGRQHPHAQVLTHAAALGLATYCTSTHGSVAVRATRAGRWSVATDRAAPCAPGRESEPR
ncbi:MAG: ComEC/Rec2 family competence protein [Gemmatimonadaceae bacterium]